MSDYYHVELVGLDRLAASIGRGPEVVQEEMVRFFAWALPHLTSEVQDRTPATEGHLRNSIIGRSEVSPARILGVVGTSLDYAPAVELGTRPHPVSMAGMYALAEWAIKNLPLGQAVSIKTGRPLKVKGLDELALDAAHAIAWKIRHYGTEGRFMFRDAFEANVATIKEKWIATVERIAARLGGAS